MNQDKFKMRAWRVAIHDRAADGRLTPVPDLVLPQPPEMDCGGHGLYATVGDYMKFIRMLLNDGAGPAGRVLTAETVAMMSRDGLGTLNCTGWTTSIPPLSNSGEFFPGIDKGWTYSFMTNREDAPTKVGADGTADSFGCWRQGRWGGFAQASWADLNMPLMSRDPMASLA